MREAFEKWALSEGWDVKRFGADMYDNITLNDLWRGWKACWEYHHDNH